MEHTQKNTDCYFFYYSTCLKGDACAFRHEPSALGCETMCSYWQQGNCLNEHCNFRHMELKKNRKSIPCYWEGQPGGCRKPHCCFMHKNARGPAAAEPINSARNNDLTSKPVNQEWSNRQDDGKYDTDLRTTLDGSSTESDQGRGGSEAGSFIGSPAVDPLVVNFEEESDNESVPSPTKPQLRMLHVKTLEEIKLERIQAESAAYYNYAHEDIATPRLTGDRSVLGDGGGGGGGIGGSTTLERNLRARLANRLYTQGLQGINNSVRATAVRTNLDFQVLSLDEIRKRRRRMSSTTLDSSSSNKVPRLADSSFASSPRSQELSDVETGAKQVMDQSNSDERTEVVVRWPKAAVTAAAPPVRLRRANRLAAEVSTRKKIPQFSGDQEPPEMTSSDSSQEAAAVPDRLTLVATRPSLSARDDRQERKERDNDPDLRLQESNSVSLADVANGAVAGLRVSRSISVPSVTDDDYLMLDAASIDHSAVADDILQDIDELLND